MGKTYRSRNSSVVVFKIGFCVNNLHVASLSVDNMVFLFRGTGLSHAELTATPAHILQMFRLGDTSGGIGL